MAALTREQVPRLYAVLDATAVRRAELSLPAAAELLRDAGVRLLQYRDKESEASVLLENARVIRRVFAGAGTLLILNDFPEIAAEAGWDGVHVGQGDAPVEQARRVMGRDAIVGTSTHSAEEVQAADRTSADYVAIGPVYRTSSKADAEAVVGLAGVRAAREWTAKPLVAIGGITAETAGLVRAAGADSVAVIGALFGDDGRVADRVQAMQRAVMDAAGDRAVRERERLL